MQAPTAVPASSERPPLLKESLSYKGGQEIGHGKRNTGRQRQDGAVLRVVRAVTGSAVKPLLMSQSSLPAVEHAAPTLPSQPSVKLAPKAAACPAAESEADIAAAEHTAMLNRYKAEWKVTTRDSLWASLYKHLEWRTFWFGHSTGLSVLDYEERVVFGLLYLALMGLLVYECCRRCMGLAGL